MAISDCDVRDPRIRRTRQLLQRALQKLLQDKSFDDISVHDITGEATLNRATFYDHYTDKYALLEAMVAAGFHELLSHRQLSYDGTCAARAIILATCDFRNQCESHPPRGEDRGAFESLVDAAIVRTLRRVLIEGMRRCPSEPAGRAELIAASASGAIYGAVKEWSVRPDRCAAAEIVPVVLQLVLPLLQAAMRPEAETVGTGGTRGEAELAT